MSHRQISPDLTKRTRDADIAFLRLRMLLLRGLGAAAELCNSDVPPLQGESSSSSDHPNHASECSVNGKVPPLQHPLVSLEKVIAELESSFKSIQEEGHKLEPSVRYLKCGFRIINLLNPLWHSLHSTCILCFWQRVIGAPLPSRLFDYLETNSVQLQLELLSLIATLVRCNGNDDKARAFAEGGKRAISVLHGSVRIAIKSVLEGKCVSLNTRRVLFERAVNTVEVGSFFIQFFLYQCAMYLTPLSKLSIILSCRWCVLLRWSVE